MKYKIVFSDIDGTLLNSKHQISKETSEVIFKLRGKNVPFILVSARMPKAIVPLQEELDINEPIICFSGAMVLGKAQPDGTREVIQDISMDIANVSDIYQLICRRFPDITFSIYNKVEWLVPSSKDSWIIQESAITGIIPCEYNFNLLPDTDLKVSKILCMGTPQDIHYFQLEMKECYPALTIYTSKPTYLEIMAPQVSKSAAIESLIQRFKMNIQEAIAIGDNYNDIDMIQSVGLGIAMGNSPDEVKAFANEITESNDEDGLKHILEKYILNTS